VILIFIIKQVLRSHTWILDGLMHIISSRLWFTFLSLDITFSIYATFGVCAWVCMPYVNLLYICACLIYHQHCHSGCCCLLQLVFVVRSFASASITLNCEVLGVCQERKGNTSMPFFLLLLSLFFSLCLICCLVYIEPVRW